MTAFKQVKNGSKSTLDGAINDTVTAIDIQPGHGDIRFPDSVYGPYWLTIWDKAAYPDPRDDPEAEIVLVSDRTEDEFTVDRGVLGTTAYAHADGSAIEMLLLDEHFNEVYSAIQTTETDIDAVEAALAGLATVATTGSYNDLTDQPAVVQSVVAGTGITVDNTDPVNPVVSADATVSDWGDIGGTLSDQTDLQAALDAKANTSHTHTASQVTDFDTEVSNNTDVAANTAARHTHSNSSVLNATTASFLTADETKLDGIEAGADVTDATNVAAAGAVMESDTSTASMSFVVDEDNMSSNSATKVPTQQSVKAYVDTEIAGVGGGGGGQWELIYSYVASSDLNSHTISGLDLDTDTQYKLVTILPNTSGNGQRWRLNGVSSTTNYRYSYTSLQGAAVGGLSGTDNRYAATADIDAGVTQVTELVMTKLSGGITRVHGRTINRSTAINTANELYTLIYNDTTNITSIEFHPTQWYVYTGSQFYIYKIVKS